MQMPRRPQLELQCGQAQHSYSPRWAQCPWRTGDVKNGEVWNFILLRKLFRILERQEVAGAVPTDNSGMPKGRSWPCESKVDVFDTLFIIVRRKQVPCGSSARFDVSVTWIASSCFNTRFERANGLCTLVCFLALSACSELNSGSMSSSAETSPRQGALSTTGKDSQGTRCHPLPVNHYNDYNISSRYYPDYLRFCVGILSVQDCLEVNHNIWSYVPASGKPWQTCYQDDPEGGETSGFEWLRFSFSSFPFTFYLHLDPGQMQDRFAANLNRLIVEPTKRYRITGTDSAVRLKWGVISSAENLVFYLEASENQTRWLAPRF